MGKARLVKVFFSFLVEKAARVFSQPITKRRKAPDTLLKTTLRKIVISDFCCDYEMLTGWLGCPKEMYSTHDQCGEPGSFPMPAYRDSYCVWRVNGHAPRMCKCFPGYFGRAGLPFCMSAKGKLNNASECVTLRKTLEMAA